MSPRSKACDILGKALKEARADKSINSDLQVAIGFTILDAQSTILADLADWPRAGGIAARMDPMEQPAFRA